MRVSIVAAVARNGVIGSGNQLPWRLPDDLQRFKALTLDKPIIMGRHTFESIGRPLPGRTNVVISRRSDWQIAGCTLVDSLGAALSLLAAAPEVMVIGGAQIYQQCLSRANLLHLTRVHADIEGDVMFPEVLPHQWHERLIERHAADARHAYAFSFCELTRVDRKQLLDTGEGTPAHCEAS
jgi:dihydrofolate reductase